MMTWHRLMIDQENYIALKARFLDEGLKVRTGNVLAVYIAYYLHSDDPAVLYITPDKTLLKLPNFSKVSLADMRRLYPLTSIGEQ